MVPFGVEDFDKPSSLPLKGITMNTSQMNREDPGEEVVLAGSSAIRKKRVRFREPLNSYEKVKTPKGIPSLRRQNRRRGKMISTVSLNSGPGTRTAHQAVALELPMRSRSGRRGGKRVSYDRPTI